MANIRIKSLGVDKLTDNSLNLGYLYKDLALDLTPAYSYNNHLNKKEYLKDVASLYDIQSVKNSIATAFTTMPGQNILNPTYGVDLRRFVFEPVNSFVTNVIENTIKSKLPKMEPRITIKNVSVVGNKDEQQFDIYLEIDVPSLDLYGVSFKSLLNTTGYTIL